MQTEIFLKLVSGQVRNLQFFVVLINNLFTHNNLVIHIKKNSTKNGNYIFFSSRRAIRTNVVIMEKNH